VDRSARRTEAAIQERLLLPAVREVILPHKLGIHNIQCWKNSAVGLVGSHRRPGADLDGDRRPREGYGSDREGAAGRIWWGRLVGLHFYHSRPVAAGAKAATKLRSRPLRRSSRGCSTPRQVRDAQHAPAAFSDSAEPRSRSGAGVYEIGYARYRERVTWT